MLSAMRAPDHVERVVGQWAAERPDLDLDTMATVARVLRAAELINAEINGLATRHGVTQAEGDILFSLRRAGPPYRLTPSQLSGALLVSSGTLTSRLDRLEGKGLIRRHPHPTDRRSMEIELTELGRKGVDAAVTQHVAREQAMLEPLSPREREQLDRLLRRLVVHLTERAG
jgi:DNA-binding MarR family transcriptional regulator